MLAAEAMRLQSAGAAETLWSLAVGPGAAQWPLLLEAAAVEALSQRLLMAEGLPLPQSQAEPV